MYRYISYSVYYFVCFVVLSPPPRVIMGIALELKFLHHRPGKRPGAGLAPAIGPGMPRIPGRCAERGRLNAADHHPPRRRSACPRLSESTVRRRPSFQSWGTLPRDVQTAFVWIWTLPPTPISRWSRGVPPVSRAAGQPGIQGSHRVQSESRRRTGLPGPGNPSLAGARPSYRPHSGCGYE